MKLEAGKQYVRRDGEVVECVACGDTNVGNVAALFRFVHSGSHYATSMCESDGTVKENQGKRGFDLIREHREPRRVRIKCQSDGNYVVMEGAHTLAVGETVEFEEVGK